MPASTSSCLPFCPQTCNASFATRDRLRSHLACHEDKVPCQVCGKYLRAAYMADHLKKHSEGPSNFCSICNRGNLPAVSSLPEDGPEPVWEAVGCLDHPPSDSVLCSAGPPFPLNGKHLHRPASCLPPLPSQEIWGAWNGSSREINKWEQKERVLFPSLGPSCICRSGGRMDASRYH